MASSAAELFPRAPSTDTYEFKLKYRYTKIHDSVNSDTYSKWNVNTLKDITQELANSSIVWWIEDSMDRQQYQMPYNRSKDLWREYRFGFEGWTGDIFNRADKRALRDVRTFLREHGVFIRTARGISLSSALAEVVMNKEEHKWTPAEIEEQLQYRTKKERTTELRREGYEERLMARERAMEEWMDEWEDYDV